jgi:hypothetical protein
MQKCLKFQGFLNSTCNLYIAPGNKTTEIEELKKELFQSFFDEHLRPVRILSFQ